jgi:hypothetical protein
VPDVGGSNEGCSQSKLERCHYVITRRWERPPASKRPHIALHPFPSPTNGSTVSDVSPMSGWSKAKKRIERETQSGHTVVTQGRNVYSLREWTILRRLSRHSARATRGFSTRNRANRARTSSRVLRRKWLCKKLSNIDFRGRLPNNCFLVRTDYLCVCPFF